MHLIVRTVALAALLSGSVAGGEPRQPTSKWIVDFDDAQCVASRNYGDKDHPLYLTFKSPVKGDSIQIAVVKSAGSATPPAVEKQGRLAFDNADPIKLGILAATVKATKQRLFRMNVPLEKVVDLRNAKSISFSAGGELNEAFAVDEVPALLKVMEDCVSDLRKFWNVYEGDGPNPFLKESAKGDLQTVFSGNDYPAEAFEDETQGTSQFVVLIDERGKIADCTIIRTSGAASLDAQSCGIIQQRAKFGPAIGHDGKPAKSAFTQRITWRLEGP